MPPPAPELIDIRTLLTVGGAIGGALVSAVVALWRSSVKTNTRIEERLEQSNKALRRRARICEVKHESATEELTALKAEVAGLTAQGDLVDKLEIPLKQLAEGMLTLASKRSDT